jgi:hypothetical protein
VSAVRLVGVHPRAELECRPRLFAALSEALAVGFEARDAGDWHGLDALIELAGASEAQAAASAGVRALGALVPEGSVAEPQAVLLANAAPVDRRLRDQELSDGRISHAAPLVSVVGAQVLATRRASRAADQPLWTREGLLDTVAVAPLELGADEPLRSRLASDRSLALLPLVHLLRELTAGEGWQPPRARAAFLLDDPNLHWPSYGYLKLPVLARHADVHGYQLALAMVPLDARFAHPAAARLLRDQRSLSLLVHGNDHFGGELGHTTGESEALALAAQSQRRVAAFERRSRISVSRVMVPPHEECSEAVARALARTGFDAITMTRPYPWLSPQPRHWLTAPSNAGPLTGWRVADFTPGNLPVMLRHPLGDDYRSPAELALRAYLDQPLIVYGHHDDLADGLDILERAAVEVNALGDVIWGSLGELAQTNFETCREGTSLRLRAFSRRVCIKVPEGVETLAVELPVAASEASRERLLVLSRSDGDEPEGFGAARPAQDRQLVRAAQPLEQTLDVMEGEVIELGLRRADAVDPDAVSPPARNLRAIARRLAGEGRDRALPLARRIAR